MKRSLGVNIAASITLLGSILCLAFATLTVFASLIPTGPISADPLARAVLWVVVALFFLAAAWGIPTAVGLFRLRAWSRISILIFSVLVLLTGLWLGTATIPVTVPASGEMSAEAMATGRIITGVFYGILAAIGAWWLYLFNKKSVKEQFAFGLAGRREPSRPVSISIIGGVFLFGSLSCLVVAFLHFPAALFTYLLTGTAATACCLVFAGVDAYIGIGLLRLQPLSRVLAMWYLVFTTVTAAAWWLLPGREARYAAMLAAMPMRVPQSSSSPPWTLGVLLPAVFTVLALWFLVTRKQAFFKTKPPEMT